MNTYRQLQALKELRNAVNGVAVLVALFIGMLLPLCGGPS